MKEKKTEKSEKNIKEESLRKEVADILIVKNPSKKEVNKSIIFDGKQYSVRIPKRFADAVGLNPNKHIVKFSLEVFEDRRSPPKITAEVIENEIKEI